MDDGIFVRWSELLLDFRADFVLIVRREYEERRRVNESEESKEKRLAQQCLKRKKKCANESPESRKKRLATQSQSIKDKKLQMNQQNLGKRDC